MARRILVLLVAALSVHTAGSPLVAEDTLQLAAVLEAEVPRLMDAERVPGLSMVLIRENRIVWKGVFGVRIAGKLERVDDQTVFEAASMSKPLFSYAVLKLVEDGRFDLDRPLDSYLPEPYLPDDPLAKKITGRMVMLHRTGLPNWRAGGWRSGGPLHVEKEPDTCFTYSGEGYWYLQTAIEQVTKQPLCDWMESSLLAPLEMTRSSYAWRDSFSSDYAGGHDAKGRFKEGRKFYEQGNAAFSLYTTPTDYARFLIEIMRRDRSAKHSLTADTIAKMTTLQVMPEEGDARSRRSVGWVVDPEENGGWVSHSGSNGSGFQCNARFNVKRQAGSVIMTNSSSGRKAWEAVLKIIDSACGEDRPTAEDRPATESTAVDEKGKFPVWGSKSRTVRYDYRLWMREQGPGSGEYWILANGGVEPPGELAPEVILVPVAVASNEKDSVLYQLALKALELDNCKYTSTVASVRRTSEETPPSDQGVLVAGGDTVLARWEHDLVSRNGQDWPLAGVKDVLSAADGALLNLECCVSLKGTPADKGEQCPFYYRARPEMLGCLTRAGIDVVTAANNHGGDYGPAGVADTAAWCEKAGLVCVGIGTDSATAAEPRLVAVGPLRVGFAGMDATLACFAATEDRPGGSYAAEDESLKSFTEKVARLGRWADGRCNLLVLTIHWGKNWAKQTPQTHREMARIAFEHGVDLILGHSAHRLQGIEVVDGKAVVYDMGNLLFDCELTPEGRRSALFRLHLSAGGVQAIEVLPTQVLEGHTVLAGYEEAQDILTEMRGLCHPLGTNLVIEEDLEGRPVGVLRITDPKVTSRGKLDLGLACAALPVRRDPIPATVDEAFLMGGIPEEAQKLAPPAELAPSVELVAYRLPATATEGGMISVSTWWRVTGPVARNVMPAFHFSPETESETPRRGTPWYTRHDAADWTVPLCRLQGGTVVEDRYPARLAGLPAGRCRAFAVVIDTTRPEGSRTLGEPRLLGEVDIQPRVGQ